MNKEVFTDNLIGLRKEHGMTQKQLADALGISDRSVSKWETGETEPDISTLCRMAELYAVPPEERPRALMALPTFHRTSLEGVWDNPALETIMREMAEYPDNAYLAERKEWLFSERRAGKLPFAVTIPDISAAWEGMEDTITELTPLWELLADEEGRRSVLKILREWNGSILVLSDAKAELGVAQEETLPRLRKAELLNPLVLTIDGKETACVHPRRDPRVLTLLLLARCLFADERPNAEKAAE